MTESLVGGTAAAPLSIYAAAALTSAVVRAARQLLTDLERGRRIDAAVLRGAMEAAFGASDATGAWDWKIAYDASEVATVLFLRKFGSTLRAKAGSPTAMLPMLAKIASLLPTHTLRSEESQALQQLSTPITFGMAACTAAAITPADRMLEPSAGTGSLAILFTTYATLRTDERGEKLSRVRQIVEWLGSDFDGVIVFDESHAMQNAVGGKGERRDHAASQQGRAGLRLQHALPNALLVYVSATGATTVHNLAYAQRLGLWGGEDFPFATRAEFVEAIEEGGVAAMEVLARDLKALGLYAARSLSYEGVEYELIEYQLTPEQVRIYEAYAGAFSIIHNNLDAATRAANITGQTGTLNAQAKSAARSAFESAKQRFFGHLLTSMKTPSLIRTPDMLQSSKSSRPAKL
jgi:hypothetical protein